MSKNSAIIILIHQVIVQIIEKHCIVDN